MADGRSSFALVGDASNLIGELNKSKKAFEDLNQVAQNSGKGMDGVMDKLKGFSRTLGVSLGAAGVVKLGKDIMNVRGEFQQLEIAFSTMLGSSSKANALMQDLTKTAAKTPFDLQGVAQGAKQLLAYGVAADEINSTIVSLGDVAAGLSIPLNDLVYLYGTTMVQGKMFTADLKQLQGRGVPILEALSKELGVSKEKVGEMVSAGQVSADIFKKAMLSMSEEGGKFAGLMANQSESITGQISNIQDSVAMMFNEIGEESEGIINLGLEGVSKLVENYKTVGTAVLALAGTYGTYKAALVVVSAIERLRNIGTKVALVNGGNQINSIKLLNAITWKQVKAQLASNAAMLASPAGLITIGIMAMVGAIALVVRAYKNEARAMEIINKAHDERLEKINEEVTAGKELISVLEEEESSYYEIKKAKGDLQKMEAFEGKDVMSMSTEQIRKTLEEYKKIKEEESELQRVNERNEMLEVKKQKYVGQKQQGSDKMANQHLQSILEAEKEITSEIILSMSGDPSQKIESLKQKILELEEATKKSNEELERIDKLDKNYRNNENFERKNVSMARETLNLEIYKSRLAQYKSALQNIEDQQALVNAESYERNSGIGLNELVKLIKDQEQKVSKVRKEYRDNNSIANEEALKKEEEILKQYTESYQKATNQQWVATEEFNKQRKASEQETSREREDILNREISKRKQAAIELNRKLEDLDREREEWQKKNQGRSLPDYFEDREKVIRLEYKTNIAELDQEFNDWIEKIERETLQINNEVEISQLEQAIELADDYNTKLEKRNKINKKQIDAKNKELEIEKKETAESLFGEQTVKDFATFNKETGKYTNAKGEEVSTTDEEKVEFAQLERFYTEFEKKRNAIIGQMEQEDANEQLNEDLQRYEDYLQGMLDAEQQYQEELARIREENGLRADADIENSADAGIKAQVQRAKDQRDAAQDIVKRDTGLTDDKWVTELGNLGAKVAGKAYDEVKKLYDEFISTINDDIAEIEAQKVAAEKIANGGDVKTLKAETQEQLYGVETQLQGPNLKEQQKVDLLQQQLELKAQIAYYDAAEQGNAETLNSLTERGAQLVKVRNKAESDAANAKQKSNVIELTQQQKVKVANKSIVQGLESVRDMANDVANTFGGALSKKAKKALETMSQVADFGIDAVKGIETIVSGVSDGMIKTTAGASASMQALEKASFILTVISLAVQLIMKIVEIASQFTKSAQLQNSIDDHLAKVEELEKRQQMIEAQYATSQGSEYYKGLSDSARAYNEIIKANKEALEEAEELYNHNLSKYGADSEKTEEAKAQLDDLALQDIEFQNSQKEAWRSLMEELSGTSLDSFAENLADALIEGFAQGKEGIDEVWEDTMDDLLRTMMRNELALALKDQFKETFKKFTEDTQDGDLSQADMDKFMENLEKGKETAEKIAGAYYDAMSEAGLLEDADAEGSQGFGQMTQDQADTLTARFTALQIEGANISAATQAMAAVVAEVGADTKLNVASLQTLVYNSNIALQIAQDQLDQMQIIADNTAMLAETNNRLKAIEQNTGRL